MALTEAQKEQNKLSFGGKKGFLRYPLKDFSSGNDNIIEFTSRLRSKSKFQNSNKRAGTKVVGEGGERNVTAGGNLRSRVSTEGDTVKTNSVIRLYTPNSIMNKTSANWQTSELGALARITEVLANIDKVTLGDVGQGLRQGVVNMIAGATQALGLGQGKDLAEYARATIANNHLEVLFQGVDHRTFNFTFKFTPINQKEAEEVKKIIDEFRFHQMPEFLQTAGSSSTSYYIYPSEFDIKFLAGGVENKNIHKIATCVLVDTDVDYSADDGTFKTFKDEQGKNSGHPVQTTLTLTFMETSLLSKEAVQKGY